MATQIIEAIYSDGALHPTEPLPLAEGEHVKLAILTERDRVRAALGDLLVPRPDQLPDEGFDEEALLREIHDATRGLPPASEFIIEERHNGP
jgi:predicted DNA-binding antitoxin AbrB/MazE fold protein